MYYTYVLKSTKDENFYVGFTKDLKLRFEQHEKGLVEATKTRRPIIWQDILRKKAQILFNWVKLERA